MDCMFSGDLTENEEHIIPRWLQRRFNLKEQSYYLPNGTPIKYKYCKIPVKQSENSEFSKIEKNISEGIYHPMELYLWALKIHIGLLYRSSNLKSDIKKPESSSILEIGNFFSEVNFFRMIYKVWKNGGSFEPMPLGSVYLHDSLVSNSDFDFIHCLPTGTISINLGSKFLTVLLWDKGAAANNVHFQKMWETHHVPFVQMQSEAQKKDFAFLARRVWSFETSINTLRVRSNISTISSEKTFSIVPSLMSPEPKDLSEVFYRKLSPSFGLEIVDYNDGKSIIYKPFNLGQH